MAKKLIKCPPGFVCTDNSSMWLFVVVIAAAVAAAWYFQVGVKNPSIYVVHAAAPTPASNIPIPESDIQQRVRPDLYPEPVMRIGGFPQLASRGSVGPVQQVGILSGEGGSSSSAAPDRTILPLYGRELDSRRGRWNYYTRTDGTNPVQVPVRFNNRVCDDDTNGCNEVYSDDSVHVPALGRSFKATVYRKSLF